MAIKPIAIKVTAGIIGTGGAIAIAYQALNSKSKPLNSNKLVSEKYTILGKRAEDEGNWITILQSYKEAVKAGASGFDNFDGTEQEDTEEQKARQTLKQKCDWALVSKDESLLDKARKWCVTPVTVKELLEARGYQPLKTDADINGDEKKKWEEKITNFWKAKKTNPNIEKIVTIEEKSPIGDDVITQIKTKCEELNKIMSHKETFKSSLENFMLFCTNKQ